MPWRVVIISWDWAAGRVSWSWERLNLRWVSGAHERWNWYSQFLERVNVVEDVGEDKVE